MWLIKTGRKSSQSLFTAIGWWDLAVRTWSRLSKDINGKRQNHGPNVVLINMINAVNSFISCTLIFLDIHPVKQLLACQYWQMDVNNRPLARKRAVVTTVNVAVACKIYPYCTMKLHFHLRELHSLQRYRGQWGNACIWAAVRFASHFIPSLCAVTGLQRQAPAA